MALNSGGILPLVAAIAGSAFGLGPLAMAALNAGASYIDSGDPNAALLGGIGGLAAGSLAGEAAKLGGTAAAGTEAAANPELLKQAGLNMTGSLPGADSAMLQNAGLELTGAPTVQSATGAQGLVKGDWSGNLDRISTGMQSEAFKPGLMRPAALMYSMAGQADIAKAAKLKAEQDALRERMFGPSKVYNRYGNRSAFADGGPVPYQVEPGVRKTQIERALSQAEGIPTRGGNPPPERPQGGIDFFRPRGKPAESQEDAAKRLRKKPKGYAKGGGIKGLGDKTMTGRFVRGKTNGQADQVPAVIDGKRPARLAHGEFVVPADVVAMLGGGNNEAGATVLQDMLSRVRKQATGSPQQMRPVSV